jgi:hypothetical protein
MVYWVSKIGILSTIFVPPGIHRGWENTGKTELKILVIKDLG